jgi:DNA gyrase subunit A
MNLKEGDFVEHMFITSTHQYILFFTNKGKVYRLKVHELPLASRQARGQAVVNILPFAQDERIAAVITTSNFDEGQYLVMATKNGLVKKTPFGEYNTSRRDGIQAINLRKGDELIGVKITQGRDDLMLASAKGMTIRFSEQDVRPMGRTATGVRGMTLTPGDKVLAIEVVRDGADLLVVTEAGFGKRTLVSKYPRQMRGGRGVKTIKNLEKGKLAGVKMVRADNELLFVSTEGIIIRTAAKDISQVGRNTWGVKVMNLKAADKISAVALVVDREKKQTAKAGKGKQS